MMKKINKIISLTLCLISFMLFSACIPHEHELNYNDYCKSCDDDFAKTLVLQQDGSFVAEEQSFNDNFHYSFNLVGNGESGFKFVFTSLYREISVYSIKIVAEGEDNVILPLVATDPFSELEYGGTFKKGVKYRIAVNTKGGGRGYLSLLPLE